MKFNPCVFLLLALFLLSCEGDQYVQYKWTALELEHLDNSWQYPAPSTNDSLPKTAYGIRLNLFPVETYREGRYFDEYESSVANENPVDSISLTCTANFISGDDTIFAGELINTHFYVFNHNYGIADTLKDDGLPYTAYYYDNYAEVNYPEYVDLLLMFPPTNSVFQKFRVFLKFNDGTTFSDTTSTIKLY